MTLCSSFIAPLHTQEFGLLYTTGHKFLIPMFLTQPAAWGWRAEPRADDIEFESRRSDAVRSRRKVEAQNAGWSAERRVGAERLEQNGRGPNCTTVQLCGVWGRGWGGEDVFVCVCVCCVCARARV